MKMDYVFRWMAHRLRLTGVLRWVDLEDTFGRNRRQLFVWLDSYRAWAITHGQPNIQAKRDKTTLQMYVALPGDLPDLGSGYDEEDEAHEEDINDFPSIADRRNLSTIQALNLLDTLRGHCLVAKHDSQLDGMGSFFPVGSTAPDPLVVEVGSLIHPRLDGPDVGEVLLALHRQERVNFSYTTKAGKRSDRTVSPHRLIFAAGAYHLRGFCHLSERMLDFNFARISRAEPAKGDYKKHSIDHEWITPKKLSFRVNPELSEDQRMVLRQTYPLSQSGNLDIETSEALTYYVNKEVLSRSFDSSHDPMIKMACFFRV